MFVDHAEGKYPVGATTFTLPVTPTRQFGSSQLNPGSVHVPGPAVTLSEIAFSVYYPTLPDLPDGSKGIDWLLRPIDESLIGASNFSGVSPWKLYPLFYFYVSKLKIPVYGNAPLLDPPVELGASKWPLVFFSHGLSGTRNAYSHLCAKIASSGKFVVLMEHRDGTGLACFPKSLETGLQTPKYYVQPGDTSYGDAKQFELRMDQLSLRKFEIYSTFHALKALIMDCDRGRLKTTDESHIIRRGFTGKVDFDRLQLVGHSFGGATIFSLLSNPPPEGFELLPITHALLHDPWLEPFPSPGPAPFVKDSKIKIAVINSEHFTLWRAHFSRLSQVTKEWGIPLYTVLRSLHEHFSDRYIVEPQNALIGSSSFSSKVIRVIDDMSVAFLDDKMENCLADYPTRKMVFERVKASYFSEPKGRLAGEFGEIIVHDSAPSPRQPVLSAKL